MNRESDVTGVCTQIGYPLARGLLLLGVGFASKFIVMAGEWHG
jgi:hypothetical protein